jgi:hypothetical protein
MSKKKPLGLLHLRVEPSSRLADYVEDEHKLFGVRALDLLEYLIQRVGDGEATATCIRQVYIKANHADAASSTYGVIPEDVLELLPPGVKVRRFRARKVKTIAPGDGTSGSDYLVQSKLSVPGFYVSGSRHHSAKLEFSKRVDSAIYQEVLRHQELWGDIRKVRFAIPTGLEVDFAYSAAGQENFPLVVTADYEYPAGQPSAALVGFRRDVTAKLQEHLLFVPPDSIAKELLKNYQLAKDPQKATQKMRQYKMPLSSDQESLTIRARLKAFLGKGS